MADLNSASPVTGQARRNLSLLALCVGLLGAPGCGYQTGSMMPAGIESIAVGVFKNETFYRQAEITYTRVLTRELVRRAHVDIRSPGEAQAILRGRILTIPRITLIEDAVDDVLEGGVVVNVEATLEDSRTGKILMGPFVVTRRAEFIVPRPESLQDSIDEAVADAARQTVYRIQAQSFLLQRSQSTGQ